MSLTANHYVGIPWKDKGRTFAGVDCVGLVCLWLNRELGLSVPAPASDKAREFVLPPLKPVNGLERGDVLFLAHKKLGPKPKHVAICLGNNKFLHSMAGYDSRIENGTTLMERVGLKPLGGLSPKDAQALCNALANPDLGDPGTWVMLIIAVVAMALSYALRPSLSGFSAKHGSYGPDALITTKDTEVPLPDILGTVTVAGSGVYQQLADEASKGTGTGSKWNNIIVLGSGPVNLVDYDTGLALKGISWQDASWHDGTNWDGIFVNPVQSKADAVNGSIAGDTNVPSITIYDGAYDISVPIDVRAQYDRDFPLYRFSGCSYLVLRAIDATVFNGLNFTTRVQGRVCRTFDSSGFITTMGIFGATGDGVATRFKIAVEDIIVVNGLAVGGTAYTEMSASNQSGNVYSLNRTKGYVEFLTPPANGATISATYDYYVRAWTQNPAAHLIYLLTDGMRGKGIDPGRIDWAAAVDFADYCDESISYTGPNGTVTGPRFQTNYSLDDRKPFQDHLQALLDACNGCLILSNGKYLLRSRTSDASVFSFDTSNILLDSNGNSTFQPELLDRSGKPNRIKLLYSSEDSFNAEDEAIADDEDNQAARIARVGNNGVVEEDLKLPACADPNQAQRLAEQYVSEQSGANLLYNFKTNIQGLALQPGDLIDVTHPILPVAATVFRIETLGHDANDQLEITASQFVPSAYL